MAILCGRLLSIGPLTGVLSGLLSRAGRFSPGGRRDRRKVQALQLTKVVNALSGRAHGRRDTLRSVTRFPHDRGSGCEYTHF